MKTGKVIRFAKISAALISLSLSCWASYFALCYLAATPQFEVKKLSGSGLRRVDENQIIAKAGFEVGTNVFRVNLAEIRKLVEEVALVRHAIVQRVLPYQIIIRIVEREPMGLARIQGEIYQFDVDGRIIDPYP